MSSVKEIPHVGEIERPSYQGGGKLAAVVGLMVVALALGVAFGREWGHFALGALSVLPFAVLALFAYLGTSRRWARWLAVSTLALIILGHGLQTVAMSLMPLIPDGVVPAQGDPALAVKALRTIALVGGGVGAAVVIAALGFLPPVRRGLARILPLDPTSFVHTIALVAIVALTLVSCVPLLVLGTPPMLSAAADLGGRGHGGMLLDEVYGLIWLVPCAVIAVGFGIRRDLKETLERLALVRPSWRQVALGVGVAAALVVVCTGAGKGIEWLWGLLGWPTTDTEGVKRLFAHFSSPLGAVIIGVVAGVGEELAVRGALQPRLGIWVSNLFFTALHAFQYHWDVLILVFAIGLVLGVLRQKTNTTTCAVVHGTYNCLLTLALLYHVPWFS